MQDVCNYRVRVRGQPDDREVGAMGPLAVTVMREDCATTVSKVGTDQAGLIGLLRHLHARGSCFCL